MARLRHLINIGDDRNWILLLSWLLAAGRPRGPYPMLVLQGEQGSAKSTTARLIRGIIDPSTAPLRTPPRDERDLVIAANNSRVVAYDNLSGLPPWLSDALCRLATGSGFSTRELYSDAEEVILAVNRPVILNSIDHLPERPDLAERSIILNLPRIDEHGRRDEAQLYAEYEQELPSILGAFYSALSCALRRLPSIKLPQKPRMADFALWATAGESGFGLFQGAFMEAYAGNRAEAVQEILDNEVVASAVVALMTAKPSDAWTGTSGELLQVLERRMADVVKNSAQWPKSARGLSGGLRRLAPFLRQAGIEIDFDQKRGKGGQRPLLITRLRMHTTVPTVPTARIEAEEHSGRESRDSRKPFGIVQPSQSGEPRRAGSRIPLHGATSRAPDIGDTVGTVVCAEGTGHADAEREAPERKPVDSFSKPERPMSRAEAAK
jgi:hypothetical protein